MSEKQLEKLYYSIYPMNQCETQSKSYEETKELCETLEKEMISLMSPDLQAMFEDYKEYTLNLKAIYKDNADTIEGNCDTTLFLGGKEKTTLKEIAEILGKETIDLYNTSDTRGSQRSYGMNYQKTGKDMPYLFVKSSVALNFT